ncbi:MAG: hypothetical protein ACLTJG_11790 [[Clostridium] innocuum]
MKNAEKYGEVFTGYTYWCDMIRRTESCEKVCMGKDCDGCFQRFGNWLNEEYVEVDWTEIAVDTPILVSHDSEFWSKRYFAKYENGNVYAWQNGSTSWSSENNYEKTLDWEFAKLAKSEDKK